MKNSTLIFGTLLGSVAGMLVAHMLKKDKTIGALAGAGAGFGAGCAYSAATGAAETAVKRALVMAFPTEGVGAGAGGPAVTPPAVTPPVLTGLGAYFRAPRRQ